jgi:hypothetical protein
MFFNDVNINLIYKTANFLKPNNYMNTKSKKEICSNLPLRFPLNLI